jgi:hypothetical protein
MSVNSAENLPPGVIQDYSSGATLKINSDGSINVLGGTGGGASGSTGIDHSANQPTLPVVGANFGNSGIYANYVLVQTISARSGRFNIEVQNQSSAQALALRDDGTAASGAAPANATLIVLGAGSGPGAQGGGWSSSTFRGRLQIYAPSSTAQIGASED